MPARAPAPPPEETRSRRLKVHLVDDEPARRLELTAALTTRWDVHPLSLADEPLKAARAERPDMVLLAMRSRSSDAVLRLCRTLRTDVRPIFRVGVYEEPARARGPWIAMELWMADGHLLLPTDAETFAAWAEAVWRGERPAQGAAAQGGGVGRLLRRLARPLTGG
jgi:DNA-binding response OmpR family regulator